MNVVHYEPMRVMRRFQDEMNRLFGEDWHSAQGGTSDLSRVATSEWTPAVDVKEEPQRYVIVADVPGVDPKEIDVTMENGVLSIKGERATDARQADQGFKRVERASGSFYRRFSLPDTADPSRISATSSHSVLEVVIPKKEALQPRRIEVR